MAAVPPPLPDVTKIENIDINDSANTAIQESCDFYKNYNTIFESDKSKTVLLVDCANLINTILINNDEFNYYSSIIKQTPTFINLFPGHNNEAPSVSSELYTLSKTDNNKKQIIIDTIHLIKIHAIRVNCIVIFINNRSDYHNVIDNSPRNLNIIDNNPLLVWGGKNGEPNIYYINIFCYNVFSGFPIICWPGDVKNPRTPAKAMYDAWHDLDDYMLLTLYWIFICNGFQNVFIISGDNYSRHSRKILAKIRADCIFCNGVNLKGKKKKYFNLKNITIPDETKLYRQVSLPDASLDTLMDILPELTEQQKVDLQTIFNYEKINDFIDLRDIHKIFGMTDRKLIRLLPVDFNNTNLRKFEYSREVAYGDPFKFTFDEFKEYYKYLIQLKIGNRDLNVKINYYEDIIRILFNKCKKEPKRDNIMEKDRKFFKRGSYVTDKIDFKDILYKIMIQIVNKNGEYTMRDNNINRLFADPNPILNHNIDIDYGIFKQMFLDLRNEYGGIPWNKIQSFHLSGGSIKTRKNHVVNNKTRKHK
jgi:hypothetical protein